LLPAPPISFRRRGDELRLLDRIGGQEHGNVTHKEIWILVLRPVIGVGVQDQLGAGDVLLQDEGIHRVDEHIVAAVRHKRRLTNLL
jgi:hypothetical protein